MMTKINEGRKIYEELKYILLKEGERRRRGRAGRHEHNRAV